MYNHHLRLLIVLCSLIITSCSSNNEIELAENNSETAITFTEKTIELNILNLVNDYRVANGYSLLNKLEVIKTQTSSHTNYMIDNDKISHDLFYQRKDFLNKNTNATSVGENVAYGYSSAESVVNAWLKSDGHKKNIEGDYTHFEITAEKNTDGKWYFTNIFVKK
ncbi:CAP domain-containing protein [Tenacibaculum sp. AHE15PA]|uniref:CAP domain-containing protein n=1 Tax=unclassified Tenacibaculum TaxID=2635139 RepID=UPI001C502384|nr:MULTISPECIES: CAP domain-containing protein [unclassified Tenacibaculum]QXP73704.1 CAP domain-containing protein [Tenacibaculum sp. AHE14PA]QXP75929.1 CAP domain-containing protein [Tenacibaculum sp. AHE15PA]